MTNYLLLFTIMLTTSLNLQAQKVDTSLLNQYLDALEVNNKFMGRIALAHKGFIIYERNIGYSDIEAQLKADAKTSLRIGSISKTFTATLVMKAIEEGLLKLNDPIDKWFPLIEESGNITIENLMRHSSGIYSVTDEPDYLQWNTQPKTEQDLLNIITSKDLLFVPGSAEHYSNSNYILLSYILENIYKKPFKDILEDKIIHVLGLRHTFVDIPLDNSNFLSKSYSNRNRQWNVESVTHVSIPMGAGNIASTPRDLVTFIYGLFSGKVLKPESLAQMKEIKDVFGYGLFELPFNEKVGYGHTGGIDGFASIMGHFVEEEITCVILSNGTAISINDIAINLLNAVFGLPIEIPTFNEFEVSTEDLQRYVGIYASSQIPIKINVFIKEDILMAQATGQPSFDLEAVSQDVFRFVMAGLVMKFNPSENTFLLKQGGAEFLFKKE